MYDYSEISFQHIQYFITIAEQGTMNKAAEMLHVSPSLLSQKISQLENLIGIELFRRSKQRLYLTGAGNQLLIDFKDILSRFHFVLDSARETYCPRNALTIGFTDYQESNSFHVCISEFQKVYPDLDFSVEIQPRSQLQTDFLDGKIDMIAITDFDKLRQDKAVQSRIAFMIPVGCYLNTSLPIARNSVITWKQLDGATCILAEHLKNSVFVRDLKRKFCAENVSVSIQYHKGDIMTVSRLVTVNSCITFAGYRPVEDSKLKCAAMPDLSYPYVVAWHADAGKEVSACAETLYNIVCKELSPFK